MKYFVFDLGGVISVPMMTKKLYDEIKWNIPFEKFQEIFNESEESLKAHKGEITTAEFLNYLSNYIDENLEENTMIYSLNDLGRATLKELLELIPGVNLHNIKKMINKNITKVKTDFSIDTTILPIKDDEYKVSCYIKDGNDELINITLYAGSKEQAKNIAKNWDEKAEEIYNQLLKAMTKE